MNTRLWRFVRGSVLAALCGGASVGGDLPKDIERLDAAKLPHVKAPAEISAGVTPLHVKVLVLEFDPFIPGRLHAPDKPGAEPKGIREVAGWNDPVPLAAGYVQDVCDASGGQIQIDIAEWLVVRRFQQLVDGFSYDPESYMAALKQGTRNSDAWHKPQGLDYPHLIDEFQLIPRIESREIDEVWMMGVPYFGYWESAMAGKGAFEINGGVYDQVPCPRRFAIMGFNVERGVAEMIHDLCHRTEASLSRVYGGWEADKLTSNWARFAANLKQSGTAAVGTCHYPPNAEKDYDYANPRMVESTADEWLSYPDLTGRKRTFSCEEWSGPYKDTRDKPDYQRNFMKWWFTHIPRAGGINADGRLNNWWEYVFDFNAYDERGKPLPGVKPAVEGSAGRRPA